MMTEARVVSMYIRTHAKAESLGFSLSYDEHQFKLVSLMAAHFVYYTVVIEHMHSFLEGVERGRKGEEIVR